MKTCPVCGAKAFDDAAICYGCLYGFDPCNTESETIIPVPERSAAEMNTRALSETEVAETGVAPFPAHGSKGQEPPEFCICLTPHYDVLGEWKWDCSVQLAEKIQHEVGGRHAVQIH